MVTLTQSTARNAMIYMVSSSDHLTGATGLTLTITASKAGGAFASISPTVTERGNGWYSLALTSSHTDTLGDFVLRATATGADSAEVKMQVVVRDDAGTGARTVTITVNDGSTVLESARVRVTQGTESHIQSTNVSGVVTFNLDDATWTVSITKAGYSFAGASLVVNGTETQTYSMTQVTTPASDPDETTAYITVRDNTGTVVEGATVQVQILKFANGTTGSGIDDPLATETTNASGYAEFPGLPRLATYRVRIGTDGDWYKGKTLDADTTPLAAALGVAE